VLAGIGLGGQPAFKLPARHHPQLPLVQLSYDQRASDVANAVVQECRGLLLEKNTWRVVMMPFSKFFNADEPNAKATREAFDWSTARVYEKLDGSLTTLYWYGGCWHVASMRLPAADGEVPGSSGGTFACIFWKAFAAAGFSLPIAPAAQQRCFMFELCLPGHTIVVRHATASLSLIGARDVVKLEELDVEVVGAEYGWTTPARPSGRARRGSWRCRSPRTPASPDPRRSTARASPGRAPRSLQADRSHRRHRSRVHTRGSGRRGCSRRWPRCVCVRR
jgi:hypothetical protein